MLRKTLMAGLVLGIAGASSSLALTTLQFDINSLAAQSKDSGGANAAFGGVTHTGSIDLSLGGTSALNSVSIVGGGSYASAANGWVLSAFSGSILLSGGAVTGGSISFTATNGGESDTYSATIVSGSGSVVTQAGQGFSIDGLTFAGTFVDGLANGFFAGFDITQFLPFSGGLTGSFINFAFNPDAGGADSDADLDVFVVIPLPTSAGLATVGLAGLAGIRRRR